MACDTGCLRNERIERNTELPMRVRQSFFVGLLGLRKGIKNTGRKLSDIFLTIPDKLFPITPNLYKLPCFEVRPAELGFKRFPEAEAGRGKWCAMQGSNLRLLACEASALPLS